MLRVRIVAGRASERVRDSLIKTVRHMSRLDEDLSAFYVLVPEGSELSWCATGAGRMLRAPTVFEDVVNTIRTTNNAIFDDIFWVHPRVQPRRGRDRLSTRRPSLRASCDVASPRRVVSDRHYALSSVRSKPEGSIKGSARTADW
jgi:hypothetical protein